MNLAKSLLNLPPTNSTYFSCNICYNPAKYFNLGREPKMSAKSKSDKLKAEIVALLSKLDTSLTAEEIAERLYVNSPIDQTALNIAIEGLRRKGKIIQDPPRYHA